MRAAFAVAACVLGCGARSDLWLDHGADASVDVAPSIDAAPVDACATDAGAACTNLQCRGEVDNCACHGLPPTTIKGRVYDPAGLLPLYNVYVYIPNAEPEPIAPGNPACTSCEAPVTGAPIVAASTDVNGAFTLAAGARDPWPVPSGRNLPLVVQLGKWRRQILMPYILPCTENRLPDPPSPPQRLRLPANGGEGDMPLIAFTSGCDPAECFLRRIGISDSEFVPPGSPTGHVHFFTGRDVSPTRVAGSAVVGGNTPADTYHFWQSAANLLHYDVVFNSCECEAIDRGASAYPAMHEYLSGGGRLFAGHFFYNWFAPPAGPTDYQGIVDWSLPETSVEQPYTTFFVDDGFPKGKAFADWLIANELSPGYGELLLNDTRYAMNATRGGSHRWIYNADLAMTSTYATMFMGVDTPLEAAPSQRCGRAVLNEMHVAAASNDAVFPQECVMADPTVVAKQQALEFLFFDLFSCVQDESQPPVTPTWK